jgi:glycosyltransferase involved in cell wall biosynthesis
MQIFVNGRFRSHKTTGLQRYAHEISSRLPILRLCQPGSPLRGWQGHLWEQTVLPFQSRSGLLWSPCATGPVSVTRQIVTFHDLFPLECPQWYRTNFVLWYRLMLNRLAATSTHLIAVSHYTKKKMCQFLRVPEDKVTVIHHGIDPAFFSVTPADVDNAAATLQLPSRRYLLFVGSLEPRKNLGRLLAAWAKISSELPPDLWLVVAGAGDRKVYENAALGQLPQRVHLTGYVSDAQLRGLYAGAMAFVYPSLAEGFGFPPLEAMAAGIPVLTSNLSALPEICGSDALYADPTDTADIARSLKLLATDTSLRQRLADAGPRRALQFNWDKAAALTLAVLERHAQVL